VVAAAVFGLVSPVKVTLQRRKVAAGSELLVSSSVLGS